MSMVDEILDMMGSSVTRYREAFGDPTAGTYPDAPITETSESLTAWIAPWGIVRARQVYNVMGEWHEGDMVGLFKSDADIQEGDWVDDGTVKWDVENIFTAALFTDTKYLLAKLKRRET